VECAIWNTNAGQRFSTPPRGFGREPTITDTTFNAGSSRFSTDAQETFISRLRVTHCMAAGEPGSFLDSGTSLLWRGFAPSEFPIAHVPNPCRICDMDSGRGLEFGHLLMLRVGLHRSLGRDLYRSPSFEL
jgi:hypothetical protein